ncbi:FHA domain-containing protein [Atopobium sp. oral taxon 416]|uniref:FHA domain-containing protein n=1 Tax=Atopobium sp. oral taxon 416 TaxID=712157 RepID=UPI001BAD8BEF|nr:FHA domain-containing protein [Atopobium sp. oral taxon 416]QUC03142.1 FHA domain-containing protein [Atopobium sp. oral taxon 416]
MRFSERKDWHSGSRTLQVVGEKREKLEYAQAEWLAHCGKSFLLPFAYEQDAVPPRLYYDVTGLARLRDYLKAKVTSAQYLGMLATVYKAMVLCTKRGYPTSGMCFDPDHAYIADGGALRLAFVPLSGGPEPPGMAPLAMLAYLSARSHVKFVVDDDNRLREQLDDFVRRTPVLSISALQTFLTVELGMDRGEGGAPSAQAASVPLHTPSPLGRGSGTPSCAAAFDMVGMLSHRASAFEVTARQGVAKRAVNGVADISPTAPFSVGTHVGPADEVAESTPSAPASLHESRTVLLGSGAGTTSQAAADGGRRPTYVLVRERDGSRHSVDLSAPVTVGRSVHADVQIEGNGNLSRRHARLSTDGGGITVQDLGSLNGIFVRGTRLPKEGSARVEPEERFRLADEAFYLLKETREPRDD